MADYAFIAQGGNPVEQLGKLAAVQGQLNQNRLFAGQQAAGAALQAATGPDGQVDFARAAALIGQDPRTAPYAMEAINKLLAGRQQDIANTSSQQKLAEAYSSAIRNDVVAAHAAGEDPISVIARRAATGAYPLDFASRFIGGSALSDGSTFDKLAKEAAVANGTEAGMEAEFGKAGDVQTGGQHVGVIENRVTGARDRMTGSAATIQNTLSPTEKAAPRTYVDARGVTHQIPTSAVVTPEGEPRKNAGGVTGPRGELTTSLEPGEAEARAAPKLTAAGQAGELGKAVENSVPRAALLHELLGAQGDFRSGPGAAKWSGIVSEFNRITGAHLANDAASAQQTFGKLAEQVAEAQRGAMGSASTNAQTEAARIASPNTDYSQEANRRVIALLLGNEDYLQVKQQAWRAAQRHGWSPSDYNDFVSEFNSHYDPRYFAEKYMTPGQQGELKKELGGGYQGFETKRKAALGMRWDR